MFLLFGLALVLNVNTAAADSVTTVNTTPQVTAIDPVNKAFVLNNKVIKVKFNEPITYGNKLIQLKSISTGKIKPTKNTISCDTLNIRPTSKLTKGAKYQILIKSGSVEDLYGNGINIFSTSFTVSPITLAQMKDGLKRAQKFYNKNHRLPNYVHYGTKKIHIAVFLQIIGYQGMKIKGFSGVRPVYITSDNINNPTIDNARINSIVAVLRSIGINAYNMGLGPNTHIKVLQSSSVACNALVVNIYGGADAGVIYEMGSTWYKTLKSGKKVFTIFWPPAKIITGLAFLERAHDDNYDPPSFTGLANPDQYLINNGYSYLYSDALSNIVSSIFDQSTT